MNQSELYKFTCQCLILNEHPELTQEIKEKFVSGEADLDRFINLCSNHFVLPAIYLRLKNCGLIELFPNEYTAHIKEIYRQNKKRNIEILQQIDEISSALEKEDIEPVYLKGTANLMDGLYSDQGERMIGDIDFLVREKDYLKTAELILDIGYENQYKSYSDFQTMKHYPRLFRKDVPADVEIHRIPVREKNTKQFNTRLLFQNKKAIKNRNYTFVSSNEHKLIHTFIHSQLSNKGYQHKIIGLRDLYDFYLLSARTDVDKVLKTVEERQKAQYFAGYINYLMSIPDNKDNPFHPSRFQTHHQYFLNHPLQHRAYLKFLDLYELFFIRYLWRIVRALFQKSSFKYIYVRLKEPKWYGAHFKGLWDLIRR